jgi:hypothetical protein
MNSFFHGEKNHADGSLHIYTEKDGVLFEHRIHITTHVHWSNACKKCQGGGSVNQKVFRQIYVDDGPEYEYVTCSECKGTGLIKPVELPYVKDTHPELWNALQKAWRDEWNRQQNAEFKLTMPDSNDSA